jgi:hypothetical protein
VAPRLTLSKNIRRRITSTGHSAPVLRSTIPVACNLHHLKNSTTITPMGVPMT